MMDGPVQAVLLSKACCEYLIWFHITLEHYSGTLLWNITLEHYSGTLLEHYWNITECRQYLRSSCLREQRGL
jgi:hypothetical protein